MTTPKASPAGAVARGVIPAEAADGAAAFAGRAWAIQQAKDWADNGSERFLILVGEPGWGKSTLAAWLVGPDPSSLAAGAGEPVEPRPITWSAWHFCDSNLGQTINPQQFIASLSVQLASRLDGYGYAIVRQADPEISVTITADTVVNARVTGVQTQAININAKDAREVYDQAVRAPLEAVIDGGGHQGPIFILVDGLDDALAFSSPTIVELLATSGDFPAPVRFLLTTRNDPLVLSRFPDASQRRVVYLSDPNDRVTTERNDADVKAFVTARAAERDPLKGLEPKKRASLIADLVTLSNGNFLVAKFLLTQVDPSGALPDGVPPGLYPLYGDFLGRIMPDTREPGVSEQWTDEFQPLLGALSVARPAAPTAVMPEWLGNPGSLNVALSAVGQVVEYVKEDGGGRRLYHRSLADFLGIQELPGAVDPEPNRYFVDPREQHRRIAEFYLGAVKDKWGGDWSKVDAYGLRQLVPHLFARFGLTDDPTDRLAIAEVLCTVALDRTYQTAQIAVLGDASATIEACRLALEVSVAGGDLELILARARLMAESQEPEIRILAARVLKEASATDRAVVLSHLKTLVR